MHRDPFGKELGLVIVMIEPRPSPIRRADAGVAALTDEIEVD